MVCPPSQIPEFWRYEIGFHKSDLILYDQLSCQNDEMTLKTEQNLTFIHSRFINLNYISCMISPFKS